MSEIFQHTDDDDYSLAVREEQSDELRFIAKRLDDGDYVSADVNRDAVRKLYHALGAWLGEESQQ